MWASRAFVVTGLGTALLAADQGGFFPRTWPWAALAFAAVAALTVLYAPELRAPRAALVLVGGVGGLAAWTACSVLWSLEPDTSLQEAERAVVYVAAALALTLLAAAAGGAPLLLGLAAGAVGIASYSLVDRVLHGAHVADQQGSLLERPLGYANALGALCAIGLVIVVTFALGTRSRVRTLAAIAAALPLGIALVLTASRGSMVAAGAGLAIAATLVFCGRRWAVVVAALAAAALVAASVLTAVAVPAALQARGDYWHVAWHVAGSHPLLGTGAGTYDLAWAAFGDLSRWGGALDAHSLYLESLAELGAIGLLLVAALVAPVVSGLRTERRSTALAASLGGAAAFLVHGGLDWDWEMPAVTVAGLACLAATLGSAEPRVRIGPRLRGLAFVMAVGTVVAETTVLLAHAF